MNKDDDPGGPTRNLDSWTIDRLEAFVATQRGEELEQARVIAESHVVHRSDEPTHLRRRWAKLSLRANQRLLDDGQWHHARMNSQAFALRTWVIEHLGPDTDPEWDPQVLAADTLATLTVDPKDARTMSTGWRDLPIEQIGELRRQKNLTAHLDRLVGLLQPGPNKDQLVTWLEVRELLP